MSRSNYRWELTSAFFTPFALTCVEGGVIGVIAKKTFDAPTLHIKIYTVGELRRLLTSVGFRIDRFDTYPYIAVPSRDAVFNLPLIRSLMRDIKGDVQIFRAVKP